MKLDKVQLLKKCKGVAITLHFYNLAKKIDNKMTEVRRYEINNGSNKEN